VNASSALSVSSTTSEVTAMASSSRPLAPRMDGSSASAVAAASSADRSRKERREMAEASIRPWALIPLGAPYRDHGPRIRTGERGWRSPAPSPYRPKRLLMLARRRVAPGLRPWALREHLVEHRVAREVDRRVVGDHRVERAVGI